MTETFKLDIYFGESRIYIGTEAHGGTTYPVEHLIKSLSPEIITGPNPGLALFIKVTNAKT